MLPKSLLVLFLLASCGEDYNNVTPLPVHNACSVVIPDYPNECFTCRQTQGGVGSVICKSETTECLIRINGQWGCYQI
jgi:hypothetical protein